VSASSEIRQAVAYTAQHLTEAEPFMAAREGVTSEEYPDALKVEFKLLCVADQAAYLQLGGKLATVIDASDQVLRQSRQIKGLDRRANITNASFATPDPRP